MAGQLNSAELEAIKEEFVLIRNIAVTLRQEMRHVLDTFIAEIRAGMGGTQAGMARIQEEMGRIRAGMAQIQEEMGKIRAEIGVLRQEFLEIQVVLSMGY